MQFSKKWLFTGLAVMLLAGGVNRLLKTVCRSGNERGRRQRLGDAYNYNCGVTIEVKADDKAVLGTKGGLSEQEAQQELQLAEMPKSPDGQQMINFDANAKVVFNGVVDGQNLKYDLR